MTPLRHMAIVGGNGMLGRAWRQLLQERGIRFQSQDLPEIDITDPASLERCLSAPLDAVINCAAWTDVDGAEDPAKYALALKINAEAVRLLAQRCRRIGAVLVHYSTDYVFNGQGQRPYPVDGERDPVNAYGRSKAEGEAALQASGCEHLLVRTAWLYAPWANNFVRTIARLARTRASLRVVDDQRGRPTSAEHLAAATLALLERGRRGAWHVCDGGECTWFEFAAAIAAAANPACRVEPCTSAEFPRPARRPAYSVLDLSHTEALLGPMPPWRDNLSRVMQRLEPLSP